VRRLAESLGLHARIVSHLPTDEEYSLYSSTDFVLVTENPKLFERPELADVAEEIKIARKVSVWTDDFNNLLEALR
jgi:hypothetical protein